MFSALIYSLSFLIRDKCSTNSVRPLFLRQTGDAAISLSLKTPNCPSSDHWLTKFKVLIPGFRQSADHVGYSPFVMPCESSPLAFLTSKKQGISRYLLFGRKDVVFDH